MYKTITMPILITEVSRSFASEQLESHCKALEFKFLIVVSRYTISIVNISTGLQIYNCMMCKDHTSRMNPTRLPVRIQCWEHVSEDKITMWHYDGQLGLIPEEELFTFNYILLQSYYLKLRHV